MNNDGLEELADQLLEEDAKARHTTLYREGILTKRRWQLVHTREISLEGMVERSRGRQQ